MTRVPRVTGAEVLQALQRAGFEISHIRGSHHYLRRAGVGRIVCVPVHGKRTLPIGTLRSVLRQAEISAEDLQRLL